MHRVMAGFVLACCCGFGAAADEDRVPAPPAAEVEKASKLVRDLFKDEFAKTTMKSRVALAEKLLKQADATKDDPAAQYALYREAANVAVSAGEVDLALTVLDSVRGRFVGIPSDHTESVLKGLATKATAANALPLATYLLKAVDDAVAGDDLASAERLVKVAETAALRTKSVRMASLATARVREVEAFKKDAAAVQLALKALEAEPNDAAAASVAGRYYCFQKDEWEKGLKLLAACDDVKLKAIAQKEVAKPKDANDLVAIADAWYDAGKAATASHAKRGMLERSHSLYMRAAPDLAGLSRTRVDKRLEELEKTTDAGSLYDELWTAVRGAVRNKDVEELRPLGGAFSNKEYRESAPGGGVLIGFHYGTRRINNHDIVGFLQPIYMTPSGEKPGAAYGKPPAKVQVVKAKSGYAVASMRIRGGGLLENCSITFMRIQGKGLNPADKYESPVIGRDPADGGQGGPTGDSRPVVGLYGRLADDGDICTIGLIVAGAKPKK